KLKDGRGAAALLVVLDLDRIPAVALDRPAVVRERAGEGRRGERRVVGARPGERPCVDDLRAELRLADPEPAYAVADPGAAWSVEPELVGDARELEVDRAEPGARPVLAVAAGDGHAGRWRLLAVDLRVELVGVFGAARSRVRLRSGRREDLREPAAVRLPVG